MDRRIQKLDDQMAVAALQRVALRWIDARGIEAFVVVESLRRRRASAYNNADEWLSTLTSGTFPQAADSCRLALDAVLHGEDRGAARWVQEELEASETPSAHALEPISLAIVGLTVIGMILAARVKRVGDTEFFEGVPKEVVDIVREATRVVVPPHDGSNES